MKKQQSEQPHAHIIPPASNTQSAPKEKFSFEQRG